MTNLYILYSPHKFKIGISKNTKRRLSEIKRAERSCVYLVIALPVLFAYKAEQVLHKMFGFCRLKSKGQNGGTEWFGFGLMLPLTWIVLVLALLAQIIYFLVSWGLVASIILFSLYGVVSLST